MDVAPQPVPPPPAGCFARPRARTDSPEALLDQLSAQKEELRTQNAQLVESQVLLQQILSEYADLYDHAPVAFVTLEPRGLLTRMNFAAERLIAVRRDRLSGMPFHAFVTCGGGFREFLRRCRAGERRVAAEVTLTGADGRQVPVELIGRPAVGSDGFFVAVLDLTERKQAEARAADLTAQLERRTSEAEHYAARLRALAAKLTEAEAAERRRLARNLHDHLQQELVAAKYRVAIALADVPGAAETLREIEASIDRCFESSRQITADLTPPPLQQGAGLAAALRWLADRTRDRHGLEVAVAVQGDPEPAGDAVRTMLYEAARELLFNVVKHAGVSQAAVSLLRPGPDRLRLTVSDEGHGFEFAELLDRADFATGLGLFGLRERVENLGGTVEIRSGPGSGTAVTIEVPDLREDLGTPEAEPTRATDLIPR